MASSSSVSVFDNYRFKSAFNEELYNSIVKNKKVIAECCIDLDEDEYPEVKEQIALRGWRRLAAPKQEISIDLIHEFYANAILTEEEMEEVGGHTFRSYVRGKVVDFSPKNLRNVMRFRAQVQGTTTDFETRKEHDQQLDQVLADLCIPGATWKLSIGQLRVPIQLRWQELNPVARGWHEFSIHSLIPSSNRSEIPVIRAILIHCIMRGVPLREFRRTRKIQAEKPINARRMESTRLSRPVQQRQHKDEDEPMPQAEEGNEGQAHDYDYHHQPEYEHHQHDYEQPQPEFEHHKEFNEPPVQPPPYHVPTYTDQHQKDLDSIETQLQNMMWYQQQALENMSKNQAEYMDELRDIKGKQQELYENNDRQDHKLLGKEILDVKKYQMSAVTMGSSGSGSSTQPPPPPPYEPDQALMKIREQHATFTEICRQLKDWTRNVSGRECYTVWAHQLANPNLVEMSSQKIVKQIYDNIDHKRPMFKGLLKSDLQPSDPIQHPSSSKDPKDPPSLSKDPKDHPK
ncbi:hypothetical protein PIB30_100472 [Stylosanthes scabra]|uniref:Putative plant transposon protein domain-containing protein n=1 Tax=Stylosanthes scabra TaxID=79078 RepID=A0ABU6VY20_9FABA|nr:hypothetical protein [Stylosanthes scabra]